MSTQPKPEYLQEDISEQAIHDYLAENPGFFERHRKLLDTLRLPHGSSGAVSLVERQVSMLRQKELKLERRLRDLIEVARANERLAGKIHGLSLRLLGAQDLNTTIEVIENSMRIDFGADQSILVLFADPELLDELDGGRFLRVLSRDSESLKPFATFLNGNGARCGQVRDTQRDFLFPSDASEIGSVALVPLGNKAEIGFLAIGSADAARFHPGMGLDFLSRLGDLASEALRRF